MKSLYGAFGGTPPKDMQIPPNPKAVSDGMAFGRTQSKRAMRAKARDGQVQGRRKGFFLTEDPGTGKLVEKETYSCGHCQRHTILEHSDRLDDVGVYCLACERPCCKGCADKMAKGGMCETWEAKFDRIEARARARASMGL